MPFRELPGAVQCKFRKGERIMRAGEPIDFIYYLTKGTVYREVSTDRGYESILSRKRDTTPGKSLIGILASYNENNNNICNSDFIAHTDCVCYRIATETCKAYLRIHPEILEEVVRHSMDEYTNLLKLFEMRRDGSAGARLCALLLERANWSEEEQALVVSKKCTNVEISKLLSVHKVTVSRMLRTLKNDGAVERRPAGMTILKPDRLKQYAENEIELDYD